MKRILPAGLSVSCLLSVNAINTYAKDTNT